MGQGKKMSGQMRQPERDAGESDGDDAEQDRAPDFACHKDRDQHQADRSENYLRIGDAAKPNERGWIRDDDLCVAKSDECDEQTDSRGGSMLQAVGNAVDDLLANAG